MEDQPMNHVPMAGVEISAPQVPVNMTDMDDLFGDEPNLMIQGDVHMENAPIDTQIPLVHQSPPVSMELRTRVDQLKVRGCCQTIAWSRCGTIASITPDGMSVELRFLRLDADTAEWGLSEPSTTELVQGTESVPLVHLEWANTKNPELAVFDMLGRVAILTFHILNSACYSRSWASDALDDLNSVVGCYWLPPTPIARQFNAWSGPAVKDDEQNQYKYETTFVHGFPPQHPQQGKSALFCITDNGMLKLFSTGPKMDKVEETTHELESIIMSEDQITHAAMCSDRIGLMAVIATASRQLRLIQIGIDWGMAQGADANTKPVGHPKLAEKHIAATAWYQGASASDSPVDHAMAKINQLMVIPSIMDTSTKKWHNAVVMAVRSYVPSEPMSFVEAQSVLDQWEIVQDRQAPLHKAFENMGARKPNEGQNVTIVSRLKRLEPLVFSKVIVNIHQILLGKVLVLTFADGSVEYRDRLTMEPSYTTARSYDRVHTLQQADMTYEKQSPCLNVAYSPSGCSMVQIGHDKKVKLRKLHTEEDIGNDIKADAQYAAVIAGLAIAANSCVSMGSSFDDVLAIARGFSHKSNFVSDFVSEFSRLAKMQVDYLEEGHHDALVRNHHLQTAMSMLCHLGFKGQYKKSSFASKIARLSLHARSIIVLISISTNTPVHMRDRLSPLDDPVVVDALTGCHKWAIDVISWLLDSLFELMDDSEFMELLGSKQPELGPYLVKKNNIAVHFMLCSSTRGFLVAIMRRLQHMETVSKKTITYYEGRTVSPNEGSDSLGLYHAYARMHKIMTSALFKFEQFEALLQSVAAEVRVNYQRMGAAMVRHPQLNSNQKQTTEQAAKQIETIIKMLQHRNELALIVNSSIPPIFLNTVKKLFAGDLLNLKMSMKRQELFFHDFTIIEMRESPEALAERKRRGVLVDMFKHVVLPPASVIAQKKPVKGENQTGGGLAMTTKGQVSTGKLRRCVRCAAVMEDIYGHGADLTYVLAQMRICPCGGQWGLAKRGETKV